MTQPQVSTDRLDITLLKQQHFSVSGQAADPARQRPPLEYVYHCSHPLLQFIHQKLAAWIANNYAAELTVPPRPNPSRPWSTATLNRILQTCIVSDSRGINIHTFQSVEFESDLYCGVMSARCYPFNMERHPFYIWERDDNYDVAESLFDPDSMWFVRSQLFFHCTLHPIGTVAGSYNRSDEDNPLDLVFSSPFGELRLSTAGIMESKGIHRVYEPSPVPMLYTTYLNFSVICGNFAVNVVKLQ